jgi:ADP-ribose pyrophosphatase YjhB (NUDIX family)
MNRDRAFSAIIPAGKIVMIHCISSDRDFWTLPGGGVEEGESLEEAAVRETFEESNLQIKIIRYLFETEYSGGIQYCYLAEPVNTETIKAGRDPEVGSDDQCIQEAEWKEISKVKDDKQVKIVLEKLTSYEKNKYHINP